MSELPGMVDMRACGATGCRETFDFDVAGFQCTYCGMDYCEEHATDEYDIVQCAGCRDGEPSSDHDLVLEAMQR